MIDHCGPLLALLPSIRTGDHIVYWEIQPPEVDTDTDTDTDAGNLHKARVYFVGGDPPRHVGQMAAHPYLSQYAVVGT